jgi:hypothetical protein
MTPKTAMHSASSNPENRVGVFFSLCRFKFFHQSGDYIACYGQPAVSEDGWIINLPAPDFFEGDYRSLPFESELSASWVHEQAIVKQPLAKYIAPETLDKDWPGRANLAGTPNYSHADFFRDIASILTKHNQLSLALCFIQVARELRPEGPLICKMFDELTEKCKQP